MLSLPAILNEEKNKKYWEWDGWKPKAMPNAPKEVKDAIKKWIAEVDKEDSGDGDSIIML